MQKKKEVPSPCPFSFTLANLFLSPAGGVTAQPYVAFFPTPPVCSTGKGPGVVHLPYYFVAEDPNQSTH